RDLVELLGHRDAFHDVLEADDAAQVGEDRDRVGIPLRQDRALLHALAVLDLEARTGHDAVRLPLAAFVVDHDDLAVAVHHHQVAVVVAHRVDVAEAHGTDVDPRLGGRRLGAPRSGTADVEGAHGELGARLADRLGGDHADRLADVHLHAAGEVAPVALLADAARRLAGEDRADLHLLEAGVLDEGHLALVDLLVGPDEHPAGGRIDDVLEGDAAEDALAERLDDLTALHERGDLDAVHRAAVELVDDRVLRHVDQAAGEVTRVRRLERGVGQTLPRAVGGDEVLQHREALAEVRGDRGLDDLARRTRHQAAHAGELADLLGGATRAGVGHDVDRVEGGLDALLPVLLHDLGGDLGHHLRGDLLGHAGPDVDHLVVALAVGDQTLEVLLLDLLHLGLGGLEQARLGLGDDHVLERDRDARRGGVVVAEGPQAVGEQHR